MSEREGYAALRTLIDACPGHGRSDACPILNALAEGDHAPLDCDLGIHDIDELTVC